MKKYNTCFSPCTILYAMTKKVLQKAQQSYPSGVSSLLILSKSLILFMAVVAPSSDQCLEHSHHHQVLESSAQNDVIGLKVSALRIILVIHIKHKI